MEYDDKDLGRLTWARGQNAELLTVSDDGRTVEWRKPPVPYEGGRPPAWVPVQTEAHLHSGTYTWDFQVEEMRRGQIGIGFMLQWDQGLDWGFFGYLGAGGTAWAYDPSTGDVVTQTRSIAGGLSKFAGGRSGTVGVRLELPRLADGQGTFVVDGVKAPAISLPRGAVVVPAACLLREGQRVRLGDLTRE